MELNMMDQAAIAAARHGGGPEVVLNVGHADITDLSTNPAEHPLDGAVIVLGWGR
ncbi:hypothetical protein [Mycobacterium pseudokansasii]|uniref:Uncharacterized protein n=1 Tax=Mycobacterium pseudokansasii TaxID=2341080 RepID=A0A498R0F9_9MYCO|nr:hypothetical protein [Mycobacterium pseudokansasii]VBA56004.1 hypothetical protein LAUMK142_05342 [Mycobacterium pseudokansasii]